MPIQPGIHTGIALLFIENTAFISDIYNLILSSEGPFLLLTDLMTVAEMQVSVGDTSLYMYMTYSFDFKSGKY